MIAILRMGPLMSQPMEVETESDQTCRIRIPTVLRYMDPMGMKEQPIERVAVFQRHDRYVADADNLIPIFDYVA